MCREAAANVRAMRQPAVVALLAFAFACTAAAQDAGADSRRYAGYIATHTHGVVLLECPYLEHPEYADAAACVQTHVSSQDARVGTSEAMRPHTIEDHLAQASGWIEHPDGYLYARVAAGWRSGGMGAGGVAGMGASPAPNGVCPGMIPACAASP